jgi:hypothetical protein
MFGSGKSVAGRESLEKSGLILVFAEMVNDVDVFHVFDCPDCDFV